MRQRCGGCCPFIPHLLQGISDGLSSTPLWAGFTLLASTPGSWDPKGNAGNRVLPQLAYTLSFLISNTGDTQLGYFILESVRCFLEEGREVDDRLLIPNEKKT